MKEKMATANKMIRPYRRFCRFVANFSKKKKVGGGGGDKNSDHFWALFERHDFGPSQYINTHNKRGAQSRIVVMKRPLGGLAGSSVGRARNSW